MANLTGHDIGRYHLIEPLGQGGMATVYRAFDTRLERDVAIKLIRLEEIGTAYQEQLFKRFEREARALAQLSHPHIVKVHDYGEHEGAPYLVMEYVPGGTLKERLGRPMPAVEAARLLAPVAQALAGAHAKDIIHRDVKPANILLTPAGVPMLTDFGIAKILSKDVESTSLTGTGVGLGTPDYMAPEQWMGKALPQTDIYALGIVFYEMVTGCRPFTADTPAAVLLKQMHDPLPDPKSYVPDLAPAVERVIYKALAKKPEDRYATMRLFADALEELGAGIAGTVKPVEPAAVEAAAQPGSDGEAITRVLPTDDSPAPNEAAPDKSARGKLWWGLGLALLVLVLAGISTVRMIDLLRKAQAAESTLAAMVTPVPAQVAEKDGMPLVFVPAGTFLMGSADTDTAAIANEKPQHTVFLDAFWIDQTEVTNALYAQCVTAGGCAVPGALASPTRSDYYANPLYARYPVVNVTWADAKAYCAWAGRRLPTEAEWEKAARGTEGALYPWGNEPPDPTRVGLTPDLADTQAVGQYPASASPYGALDMAGNVWEWVADWYSDSFYGSAPTQKNPQGPVTGTMRILRGGSWEVRAGYVRAAVRDEYDGAVGYYVTGFRCALTP